jgi:hypothetical protein
MKIEITPDLIERIEKYKKIMAEDVSDIGIHAPPRY